MTYVPHDSSLLAPPFKQCALVTNDLRASVERFVSELGIGPWTAYRLGPPRLRDQLYHGDPAEFEFVHALAWQGDLQFELIEPVRGPSIFADHLEEHGEGLHHVGKLVDNHDQAVAQAVAAGFEPLQSARGHGAEGDGAFAYFKPPGIGLIVELIAAPRVRIEPEFVYPPGR